MGACNGGRLPLGLYHDVDRAMLKVLASIAEVQSSRA
jgi:hypothetical protein